MTDSTPYPEGGWIERDDSVRDRQVLQELVEHLAYGRVPKVTVDDYAHGIKLAQDYYFSLGIIRLGGRTGRPHPGVRALAVVDRTRTVQVLADQRAADVELDAGAAAGAMQSVPSMLPLK